MKTINGFKDLETMNAAGDALSNAAGVLAALEFSDMESSEAALDEAMDLIQDAAGALAEGQKDWPDFAAYLNRAKCICSTLKIAGANVDAVHRRDALQAARNILDYVGDVYIGGTVPETNFARLRDPDSFNEIQNFRSNPTSH